MSPWASIRHTNVINIQRIVDYNMLKCGEGGGHFRKVDLSGSFDEYSTLSTRGAECISS